MKTLILSAALLLAVTTVNANSNLNPLSLNDGGDGSHGYTTNITGNDGVRPFKASNTYFEGGSSGTRGGFISDEEGGGSSAGGFHSTTENGEGGGASAGGYQLNGEHSVER